MNSTLVLVLSLIVAAPAFADHHEGHGKGAAKADAKMDPKMDPKMAEMMKAWKEASTPGAPHDVLKPMAGKWKYVSKFWHTPDGKPEESSGTSTLKMILGGRYLQHETKGKAMGAPFEGLGFTGYNNVSKTYETTWMDNMSTATMHGTGSFDASAKTLTDTGEFACPMKNNKIVKYRAEWKIVDANNMSYSMFTPDDGGKEFKSMEMLFKRSK
jgi:hypothetical protein